MEVQGSHVSGDTSFEGRLPHVGDETVNTKAATETVQHGVTAGNPAGVK